MSRIVALLLVLLAAGAGIHSGLALAQSTPAEHPDDALTDPAYKATEVIAFMGIKPGARVADVVAGRFVRALSKAVGPTGKVYAVEPAEVVKVHPQMQTMIQSLSAMPEYSNVEYMTSPVNETPFPPGLDAVFIRQNYHDLHDKFMGPADVAAFNTRVFKALKPGGVYVVLDHAAAPGSALRDTDTLHRIDVAAVKAEVQAAGFKLDGESKVLENSADTHDKNVFDPSIRDKTDQFLLRFKKPK